PEAREIEAKIRGYLRGEQNPEAVAKGEQIIDSLHDADLLSNEDYEPAKEDAETAKGEGESAQMAGVVHENRVRNILNAIGRFAWSFTKMAAISAVSGPVGNAVYDWLKDNEGLVMDFLKAACGLVTYWVPRILEGIKAIFDKPE
ncbi:MAG: hypothetical protein AAGF71_08720, partial [Pseudomonadota bacterium]